MIERGRIGAMLAAAAIVACGLLLLAGGGPLLPALSASTSASS